MVARQEFMTIDANIIIAYLTGDQKIVKALSSWKQAGVPLFLSSIVEAEILSFSEWSGEERRDAESFLEENFVAISFDRAIARLAASLRRTGRIKLPDAAIAATALYTGSPLVTRNVRDFRRVNGLTIIDL